MLRIGTIELEKGAALAPMAGVSDFTLRNISARYGATFTVSEMVSAKALTMGDKKSLQLLRGRGAGVPYAVQLFGEDPATMAQAVHCIADEDFDFLDLNMGCPAPKIVGHGAGSALLKNPVLAGQLAKAVVQASARPVTAKMRIGWDDATLTGTEVAKRCEEAGVQLIVVHARTRAQQYTPGVNYAAVAEIKQAVSIPVLYNGDVTGAESALFALQQTGCDGVMVGRAAMGAPWLFAEVKAALNGQPLPPPPTLRQRLAVLDEQIQGMCAEKGENVAMRQARGVAAQYMRGLRGAAALRRQAVSLTHYTDVADLIESVYRYQQAGEETEDPGW
ncbi:tRNA dihydrouridine synthase DusB [Ruminococcaceae bacterium OttesenSCG-928-A16]|nr:tRNA dihydrouridine synthase DusB [Ruminococcaceae bacterium OttesenSCG-928-A16]